MFYIGGKYFALLLGGSFRSFAKTTETFQVHLKNSIQSQIAIITVWHSAQGMLQKHPALYALQHMCRACVAA